MIENVGACAAKMLVCILCWNCQLVWSRRVGYKDISAFQDYQPWEYNGTFRYLKAVSADDHKIISLPGLNMSKLNGEQFAGLLPVDDTDKNFFFYWLFESEEDAVNKPLVIWLNGGPGCSSMDGLFLELGPLKVNGGAVTINPYSWHYAANMLFIDQPVGTGLSFTKTGSYPHNDNEINTHFYRFLEEFFKMHPRYTISGSAANAPLLQTRPLYMTGESHAGHYIPFMASMIVEQNKINAQKKSSSLLHVDLKGIALGNPWTDPFTQYDVSDFMHGLGVITHGQRNHMKEVEKGCQSSLKKGKYSDKRCFDLLDDLIAASGTNKKMSMYDARKYVSGQSEFPPGKQHVEAYLNRPDVRHAIHATATPQRYVECADPPYFALSKQDGKGATEPLVAVLNDESAVNVLIYSGQYDIICNHLGNEKMIEHLQWKGREDWLLHGTNHPFSIKNGPEVAGYVKSYKNLAFAVIRNSGHMVPMDQPEAALYMIRQFISSAVVSNAFGPVPNRVVGMRIDEVESGILPSDRSGAKTTNCIMESEILGDKRGTPGGSSTVNSGVIIALLVAVCFTIGYAVKYCYLIPVSKNKKHRYKRVRFQDNEDIHEFERDASENLPSPISDKITHHFEMISEYLTTTSKIPAKAKLFPLVIPPQNAPGGEAEVEV